MLRSRSSLQIRLAKGKIHSKLTFSNMYENG